jgi:hypothetical protein
MAGTTTNGLPYPTGTDRVADGDNAIQALAEKVDRDTGLGAWKTYTPTMTGWTIGGGSVSGRYAQHGRTVHFRILAVLGAGFTAPATAMSFALPLPIQAITGSANGKFQVLAQAVLTDVGSQNYTVMALPGLNTVSVYLPGPSGGASVPSSTQPFVWVAGDFIEVSGTYETTANPALLSAVLDRLNDDDPDATPLPGETPQPKENDA